MSLSVRVMDKIVISATSGPFIAKLMENLITSDEMKTMSKTGGSCSANARTGVQRKLALPEEIKNAIISKSYDNK